MPHHHPPAVAWEQARKNLHAAGLTCTAGTDVETLPPKAAIGRYTADDVHSLMDVPHYDSSAMDGYAVSGTPPWLLVTPEYPDDERVNIHRLTVAIEPGQATPILTGGLLPRGAQSIVREEHTTLNTVGGITTVTMASGHIPPANGADIRRTGSELPAGRLLVERGTLITARLAAFLGMNGFDEIPVLAPVTARCAFTGNEVITIGVPEAGQVRDAFGGFLEATLATQGCAALPSARLADTGHDFTTFLNTSHAQVLIFTGGSSTSGVDMVRKTLAEAQATYLFESVQVRPGHPALAARLADGRIVLGLPGNPLAAYTALYSYLPPLLAGMRGLPLPPLDTAEIAQDIPALTASSQQRLIPALVRECRAHPLPRRASYMLSGLSKATHLLVADASGHTAGDRVPLLPVF